MLSLKVVVSEWWRQHAQTGNNPTLTQLQGGCRAPESNCTATKSINQAGKAATGHTLCQLVDAVAVATAVPPTNTRKTHDFMKLCTSPPFLPPDPPSLPSGVL